MDRDTRPASIGLYRPEMEKDACGVGFVAQFKKVASHQIVKDALDILCKMEHRGAVGSEINTGDGAGILTALPVKFLEKVAASAGVDLNKVSRTWAAGIVFLPPDADGLQFLGWRDVPRNNAGLGPTALNSEPYMRMAFVTSHEELSEEKLDRKLWAYRK